MEKPYVHRTQVWSRVGYSCHCGCTRVQFDLQFFYKPFDYVGRNVWRPKCSGTHRKILYPRVVYSRGKHQPCLAVSQPWNRTSCGKVHHRVRLISTELYHPKEGGIQIMEWWVANKGDRLANALLKINRLCLDWFGFWGKNLVGDSLISNYPHNISCYSYCRRDYWAEDW